MCLSVVETACPSEIDADPASVRRMVARLEKRHQRLHFCYEAGPTGYALHRQFGNAVIGRRAPARGQRPVFSPVEATFTAAADYFNPTLVGGFTVDVNSSLTINGGSFHDTGSTVTGGTR